MGQGVRDGRGCGIDYGFGKGRWCKEKAKQEAEEDE